MKCARRIFERVCRLKANQSFRRLTDQPEDRKYRLLTKANASLYSKEKNPYYSNIFLQL